MEAEPKTIYKYEELKKEAEVEGFSIHTNYEYIQLVKDQEIKYVCETIGEARAYISGVRSSKDGEEA